MSTKEDAERRYAQVEGERDYYRKMVARRDREIDRLRSTLSTILSHDVEGNIRATARDIVNAGQWDNGNDIYEYCDDIEKRVNESLGGANGTS